MFWLIFTLVCFTASEISSALGVYSTIKRIRAIEGRIAKHESLQVEIRRLSREVARLKGVAKLPLDPVDYRAMEGSDYREVRKLAGSAAADGMRAWDLSPADRLVYEARQSGGFEGNRI